MEEKDCLENKVVEEKTVIRSTRKGSIEVKEHDSSSSSDEGQSSIDGDQIEYSGLDSNLQQGVTSESDLDKSAEESVIDEDNDDHPLQIVETTKFSEPYPEQYIKSETDQDDNHRLKKRRETNRKAAQKCRQKQTEKEGILRKEFLATESRNTKLRYEITQLKKSKELLEKILYNHYCVIKKSLPASCQEPKDITECTNNPPPVTESPDVSKTSKSNYSMNPIDIKTVKPISIKPIEYKHAPIPVVVSEDQTVDGFKVPTSVPPRKIRSKGIRQLNAEELRKILKKGGKVVSIKSDVNKAMALKQSKMKAIYSNKPPSNTCINTHKGTVSDSQSVTVTEISSTVSSPKLNALLEIGVKPDIESHRTKFRKSPYTLVKDTEKSSNKQFVDDSMDVNNGENNEKCLEKDYPLQTRTSIAANALLELNRHGLERVHNTVKAGSAQIHIANTIGPEIMNTNYHPSYSIQNSVSRTESQLSNSHHSLYFVHPPVTSTDHTTTIRDPITYTFHPSASHTTPSPHIETFKTTKSNVLPVQNHSVQLSAESIHHSSTSSLYPTQGNTGPHKTANITEYMFVKVNK